MTEWVKLPPDLKKTRALSPKQRQKLNKQLGAWGEAQACSYLQAHQYQVLGTNLRFGQLELDIVALDPVSHEIAFIEVKTRQSAQFGDPSQAVNQRKLRAQYQAALKFLRTYQLDNDFRFDIISICPSGIAHFINVTF